MTQTIPQDDKSRRRAGLVWFVLGGAILVYTATLSSVAYSRFRSFESYRPQDMAAHSQAIWNTAHGRFLHETVHYVGGLNHFYPFLAVFAPIYRLTDSLFVLLLLNSLIMGSGAVPLFLLARDRLGSAGWGLWMAAAYLACPGLHYANLMDLKPIALTIPFVLFTFYFWQANRFRAFLVCLLLTASVTEQIAPLLVLFGPLSWIRRRSLAWIVIPPLVGGLAMLFAMFVFVPLLAGASYQHLRVHAFFSRFALFSWSSYGNVGGFLGLSAVFLLSSWEPLVLGIPYLFLGVVAKAMYAHYYFPLVAVLFISWVYGFERIRGWARRMGVALSTRVVMPIASLTAFAFYLFDPLLMRPAYSYPMSPSDEQAWTLIRQVPGSASVSCDPILLPALSGRARIHGFARQAYHGKKIDYLRVDYVLIDPSGPHFPSARHKQYERNAQHFLEKTVRGRSGFEIVDKQGDWVLFRRRPVSREAPPI